MNQFFSFKRFSLLISKHWAENKKRYGLSVLAIIGLLITWFVFILMTDPGELMEEDVQQVTFFMALFAVGAFYASQYFRHLGSREKGSNFLLVPASAFEKLLCALVYAVFFFFIAFVAAFYLVDVLMVAIANALSADEVISGKTEIANVFDVNLFPGQGEFNINLLVFFFSVQSIFLLGSIYFKKYSFVKTIIGGFIGCFIIFLVMYFLFTNVLPSGDFISGLTSYRVHVDGINDHVVEVPTWITDILRVAFYAIAPFGWIVTYFRLKEKQV
jgi:hypothetical protein